MRFLSRAGLWLALLAAPAAVVTPACTSEKEEDPQPHPHHRQPERYREPSRGAK